MNSILYWLTATGLDTAGAWNKRKTNTVIAQISPVSLGQISACFINYSTASNISSCSFLDKKMSDEKINE